MSPTASVDVSLDATPPTVTIDGVADGDTVPDDSDARITWSVFDAVSGPGAVDVVLDGASVTEEVVEVSSLEPGQHVLTVSGADMAGNAAQAEVTFVVEAPDPGPGPGLSLIHISEPTRPY